MTVMIEKREKPLRTLDLRVRLTEHEKQLVNEMMREDLLPTESSLIRRLLFEEARRRGKVSAQREAPGEGRSRGDLDVRKADRT